MTEHTLFSCASMSVLDEWSKNICIIPGNPGIKEYYNDYADCLHKLMKETYVEYYTISTTGHKGHDGKSTSRLYSLDDQVRYHQKQIEEKLKTSKGMILIGHSIGCHIIIELLANKEIRDKVDKAILLFPTVDRMAETSGGKRIQFYLNFFMQFVIQLLVTLLFFCPYCVRAWFARRILESNNASDNAVETTASKTLNPAVIKQVFYMAKTELEEVIEPNIDVIRECQNKIIMYYGQNDQYTPHIYYQLMKNRFPDAEIYLGQRGYRHDFVIDSSEELANLTYMWISKIWKRKTGH